MVGSTVFSSNFSKYNRSPSFTLYAKKSALKSAENLIARKFDESDSNFTVIYPTVRRAEAILPYALSSPSLL